MSLALDGGSFLGFAQCRVGFYARWHSSGALACKYGATPGKKDEQLCLKGEEGGAEKQIIDEGASLGGRLIEDMIERLWELLNIGQRGKNNMNG